MSNIFIKINNKTIFLNSKENNYNISIKELCYHAFNKYFKKYYPNLCLTNYYKLKDMNNFLHLGYVRFDNGLYYNFNKMDKKINLKDLNDRIISFIFFFSSKEIYKFNNNDINDIMKIDFTKFS